MWAGVEFLNIRIVRSDDLVNARWADEGIRDKNGQPFRHPQPAPTIEEIRAEAKTLGAAWDSIVEQLGARTTRKAG